MITAESVMIWLLIVIFAVLLAILAEKSDNKIVMIMIWLFISFIAGFRAFNVGVDTPSYVELIKNPHYYPTKTFEVSFVLLNKVVYGLTKNISIVFFVYALLMYGLVIFRLWEMRKDISFAVAFITYFGLCYFQSLNGLRQYVAVSIVFFASRYLFKGKYYVYLLFVLLAFTFHKSAIIGLMCFAGELICWKDIERKKRRYLLVLMGIGVCSIPFVIDPLMERYGHYFQEVVINSGLKVLELLIIYLISLLYLYDCKKRHVVLTDRFNHHFLKSTQIYYIMATGLWAVGYFYMFMDRIAWYFLPFVGVYFGVMMKEKRIRSIISLAMKTVIFVFVAYVLFTYIFLSNGPMHHPYHFVWSM